MVIGLGGKCLTRHDGPCRSRFPRRRAVCERKDAPLGLETRSPFEVLTRCAARLPMAVASEAAGRFRIILVHRLDGFLPIQPQRLKRCCRSARRENTLPLKIERIKELVSCIWAPALKEPDRCRLCKVPGGIPAPGFRERDQKCSRVEALQSGPLHIDKTSHRPVDNCHVCHRSGRSRKGTSSTCNLRTSALLAHLDMKPSKAVGSKHGL